jgi:ABC-type cobalamin/Fe3+-siderophores transport system ATPase subunit
MNIVLEGPDGSGKTTLARIIAQHVPLLYTPGEGPPKYPGEMVERVRRLLRLDNCLFDRHPCVSQLIYDRFREDGEGLPEGLVDAFYATKPFFIYCYGRAGAHEAKQYDSPEHLAMVEQFDDNIRNAYHEWAQGHVPAYQWYSVEYHNQSQLDAIINACKEAYHAN